MVVSAVLKKSFRRPDDINKEREKKILQDSLTDPLTGLNNRRSLDIFFKKELARTKREKQHLTFLMLDIDYFKQYNDTYGHQAGDNVLVNVSAVLKKSFRRPDDMVFRMGGEEFAAVFTDLDELNSIDYADKLRTSIEQLRIEHSKNQVSNFVTVSIGLYVAYDDHNIKEEEIIKKADEALYKAKHNGRNKVQLWK
ncbi:diguanylate cyclase (GGDEF) domain-containing protein [Candidatus Magnetoovum chiemensis]|nr:diguanylate cyclase (GGDEF) domain-containing protein [Candidatus Magnetoovum chiemensis]